MMRGKNQRSGKGTKASAGPTDNELSLADLDQVVGGAGAPPPPVKDEHVVVDHIIAPPVMAPHVTLAPSTPMIDHTQTTAAVAATELTHGQLDAQHAIAQVEAYDAGHGIAAVSGLT